MKPKTDGQTALPLEVSIASSPPRHPRRTQSHASQSLTNGATEAREELEARYRPLFEERLSWRQLVTYVPSKGEPIHGWFKYPQGFSRKLVETLLDEFGAEPHEVVFDPFCGCGTTPLTAKQHGLDAWAVDILPTAVFVAEVKLRGLEDYDLPALRQSVERVLRYPYSPPTISAPQDIRIVQLAYSQKTLNEILCYQERFLEESDPRIQSFLTFGLMAVLESVSFTSKDGQFLRLKPDKPIPPVRDALGRQLMRMLHDLETPPTTLFSQLENQPIRNAHAFVRLADARELPDDLGPAADLVLTSPPYLNRYDYSRIYSLELCLIHCTEFKELKRVRQSLLRSHIEATEAPTRNVTHPAVLEVLRNLDGQSLNNPRIPIMIRGYFEDMNLVVRQVAQICKPGARLAIVVGNVRFESELIPVDLLFCELAAAHGFTTEKVVITRYKGNSSQQMGKFGRIPVRESILFWRR